MRTYDNPYENGYYTRSLCTLPRWPADSAASIGPRGIRVERDVATATVVAVGTRLRAEAEDPPAVEDARLDDQVLVDEVRA